MLENRFNRTKFDGQSSSPDANTWDEELIDFSDILLTSEFNPLLKALPPSFIETNNAKNNEVLFECSFT